MSLRVVNAAESDPVTLDQAKAQLRITDASQDDLIAGLIAAATISAETLVQRFFMKRTVEWVLPAWRYPIALPIAPVAADGVNSIGYVDWSTAQQQTLDASLYVVQTRGPSVRIVPKYQVIWPIIFAYAPEPVVINFDAGYTDADSVPKNVKSAILLTLRHLYSLGERSIFLKRDSVFGVGDKNYQVDPGAVDLLPGAARALLLSEVWEHPC
jgi:uncharacterized phiE125 gp8 family phage protein